MACREPHNSAIDSIDVTLRVLARIAMGKAERKMTVLFQEELFTRKARIAARVSRETRLLMPLQGAPIVKLALVSSIWFPVAITGIPIKLTIADDEAVVII